MQRQKHAVPFPSHPLQSTQNLPQTVNDEMATDPFVDGKACDAMSEFDVFERPSRLVPPRLCILSVLWLFRLAVGTFDLYGLYRLSDDMFFCTTAHTGCR